MAEPAWFELRVVVRTTAELLAKLRDAVDESDLAEIDAWDLTPLDDDRRRWDGSPATTLSEQSDHPVFDGLRRGLHLHEQ